MRSLGGSKVRGTLTADAPGPYAEGSSASGRQVSGARRPSTAGRDEHKNRMRMYTSSASSDSSNVSKQQLQSPSKLLEFCEHALQCTQTTQCSVCDSRRSIQEACRWLSLILHCRLHGKQRVPAITKPLSQQDWTFVCAVLDMSGSPLALELLASMPAPGFKLMRRVLFLLCTILDIQFNAPHRVSITSMPKVSNLGALPNSEQSMDASSMAKDLEAAIASFKAARRQCACCVSSLGGHKGDLPLAVPDIQASHLSSSTPKWLPSHLKSFLEEGSSPGGSGLTEAHIASLVPPFVENIVNGPEYQQEYSIWKTIGLAAPKFESAWTQGKKSLSVTARRALDVRQEPLVASLKQQCSGNGLLDADSCALVWPDAESSSGEQSVSRQKAMSVVESARIYRPTRLDIDEAGLKNTEPLDQEKLAWVMERCSFIERGVGDLLASEGIECISADRQGNIMNVLKHDGDQ